MRISEEPTQIITPLKEVPKVNGVPIEIEYYWEGDEHDLLVGEPNAVVFTQYGDAWTKTYVYREKNGDLNFPITSGYEDSDGNLLYEVENVKTDETDQQKIDELLQQAGNFGSPDASLSDIFNQEIDRLVETPAEK